MKIYSVVLPVAVLFALTTTHVSLVNSTVDDDHAQYDKQVIAVMEDDSVIERAAEFLYTKHPTLSTVVKWNPNTKEFELVHGSLSSFGKNSRIQIVGHGSGDDRGTKLAGFTAEKLATTVSQLPHDSNNIGWISLVACDIAGNGKPNLSEDFVSRFLKSLTDQNRNDIGFETIVSARSALVTIDSTGRKLTGEFSGDQIYWNHKNTARKIVARLENGSLL